MMITPVVDMPTVLRHVYTRFAVQEILHGKLEPEEQASLPVDQEDVQDTPETPSDTNCDCDPHPDQLIVRRPAVDV